MKIATKIGKCFRNSRVLSWIFLFLKDMKKKDLNI